MRILQLCLRVPFPPRDGGSIAMYNLGLSMHNSGADVRVLALNTKKHFVEEKDLSSDFLAWSKMQSANLDTSIHPFNAIKNIFSSGSYNVDRFYSEDFEKLLIDTLIAEKYDVVHCETIYFSPYINAIRKNSDAKIVFRCHNVEHVIWQRLANDERNPLRKWYLNFLSTRLRDVELNTLNEADAILAITETDKSYFQSHAVNTPIKVVPVGLDLSKYSQVQKINSPLKLFHLGAMDWLPNIDAVEWLLENVWKNVSDHLDVELHIAGTGMPESYFQMANDKLHVYGRVDDAQAFISTKDVMLVPVFSGSGVRVKILEGFATGNAIISTTIGAEGIPVKPGVELLIADTAEDFINAIEILVNDPKTVEVIRANGHKLAEKCFDNSVIGNDLLNFYENLLDSKQAGQIS